MNEIPESDEARLRARLHTIGGVIEGRIDAGRRVLFEPGRPPRPSVWRLRGLVVGGAVAVVVLVLVGVFSVGGGGGGTDVATGPVAPAALEGRSIPPIGAVVSTPGGIVLVSASHGGHPGVYAPDARGHYAWHVRRDVPPLAPVSAWMDGPILRIVGHRCPAYRGATLSDTHGESDLGCPSASLVALGFEMGAGNWTDHVRTVDTHGTVTDIVGGSGRRAVAKRTDYPQQVPLGLIDLESGSITNLTGADDASTSVMAVCPSGGTFLVVRRSGSGTTMSAGPDASPSELDRKVAGIEAVERVDGSRLSPVSFDDLGLAAAPVWYRFGGCIDGGMVVQPEWTDRGHAPVAEVVTLHRPSGMLRARTLPTAPLTGSTVTYSSDLTQSTVLARVAVDAAGHASHTTEVAVLGHDGQWRRLRSRVATVSSVAVDAAGNVYRPMTRRGARAVEGQALHLMD